MDAFCYTPPALILDLLHIGDDCQSVLHEASELPIVSLWIYLKYFSLTCLLEAPFYFAAVSFSKEASKRTLWLRFLSALVLCNLATHPIVCFAIPWLSSVLGGNYGHGLAVGEVFAPVVEALLLAKVWKVPPAKAWILSILANLFSWWAGVYIASYLL